MNESAIVKHWQAIWKASHTYICSRKEEEYFLTDGWVMLRLPMDHLVFDSRRVFPTFPEDGQTLQYFKGDDPVESNTNLHTVFSAWANDRHLEEAEATNWLREHNGTLFRAIQLLTDKRVFVNEDFVTLINGKDDVLESYQFFAQAMPEDDNAKAKPVIVHLDGEAVAALMPIRILEQGPLFPIGS